MKGKEEKERKAERENEREEERETEGVERATAAATWDRDRKERDSDWKLSLPQWRGGVGMACPSQLLLPFISCSTFLDMLVNNLTRKRKISEADEVFVHQFNKYLLNTYHLPGLLY